MINYLRKSKSLFSTTLSTGISTGTGETITLASVTGLPTDTEITLTIDRVDSTGAKTPSKMERIRGTISGSNLINYTRGVEGTEQAHSGGAVVEIVWNASDWNSAIDGILVEHNQDGTHKSALVTTLKASGAEINTGTEDAKIVTPKGIKDAGLPYTGKASSAEITTGTEDVKYTTPKGLKDAGIGGLTKAAGSDITTGTDDAKFLTAKALADATIYKMGAAWTAFTPSWGNLTVGSGTNTGAYCQIGKTVRFWTALTLSSTTVGTAPALTLPVAKSANINANAPIGQCIYIDTGTETYMGMIDGAGILRLANTGATYPTRASVTASIPHTWANTDIILTFGSYEAA